MRCYHFTPETHRKGSGKNVTAVTQVAKKKPLLYAKVTKKGGIQFFTDIRGLVSIIVATLAICSGSSR